ncbi:SGNH/GDSL hydrolase family protein [Curtobacterium sp. MCSS17_016]|uniref:SGNH/GDSL hydrolase family protein n=1 Tax=Curtobacterium sp. MCSS17_016 TaxID=2175644 RepID=UPI000DA9B7AE|nr:SGNH/GDSL hydrolase family protein [Curtobacterium sp. MCSS17_016]WIE79605.1 SGNH/GDSL hydrolase family protein [Curtobacterium sp. MCSS17_016]
MPHFQFALRLPLIAAVASIAVLAGALLAGVPNPATAVAGTTTASTSTADKLTWTYAGDSLTEMPKSWMRQLQHSTMVNTGGTAIGNATTTRILAGTSRHDADVLVVMAGTNDLRYQRSSKTILSNIDKIVKKVGARHVVISAIAPSNSTNYGKSHVDRRRLGEILNRDLQNHALTRGWMFVDPWAADRKLDGGWPWSRTYDGVHPTVAMSEKVSVRMQQAIHIAAEGAKG